MLGETSAFACVVAFTSLIGPRFRTASSPIGQPSSSPRVVSPPPDARGERRRRFLLLIRDMR